MKVTHFALRLKGSNHVVLGSVDAVDGHLALAELSGVDLNEIADTGHKYEDGEIVFRIEPFGELSPPR